MGQRQIPGCHGENNDYILGTKGRAQIGGGLIITGKDAIARPTCGLTIRTMTSGAILAPAKYVPD